MKMPKKTNDMMIVIAADKAAKSLKDSPKKIDEDIEESEYCCPKCGHCGPESEFED